MSDPIYINARFLTQEITGVQRFAIELSKQLKKGPVKCVFVSPKINIVHTILAKELEVVLVGKYSGHLWEQVELPKYLKSIGCPILINLMNTAPIFYSNKIYTLHDITFIRFPKNFTWKFRSFYKTMIPYMLKTSKRIITVSNFSKDEISNHYTINKDKISIVYNGIKKEFMSPLENKNTKESNYFLTVSSISENKNLKRLIKAFNLINNDNFKLYVVGGFDLANFNEVKDIEELLSSKNIEFKGRVSDEELSLLYKNAIAFLYPSIYEGFGIPPLEAQGSECPILLSKIAPLKEVYGSSALYCDPFNINDIYCKIKMLFSDSELRKELSIKGNINVKKYSWDNSAASLISIIKNVQEEEN